MDEQSSLNSAAINSDTISTSLAGLLTLPETLCPRLAGVDDLDRIIELGRKFHDLSPWSAVPFNAYKMKKVLLEMMEDEDAIVLMHDHGILGGHIMSPYFSDTVIAQELFWFAEKEGMALLKAFEVWAFHEGAEMVSMAGTGIKPKALDRLYRRQGYEPRETFYIKSLD